ncbi:hypothetical protein Ddc_08769 [Ditylenchus destructor]|nr:hypothetical protein Ddc_08769 [Ditylenchus destructor]
MKSANEMMGDFNDDFYPNCCCCRRTMGFTFVSKEHIHGQAAKQKNNKVCSRVLYGSSVGGAASPRGISHTVALFAPFHNNKMLLPSLGDGAKCGLCMCKREARPYMEGGEDNPYCGERPAAWAPADPFPSCLVPASASLCGMVAVEHRESLAIVATNQKWHFRGPIDQSSQPRTSPILYNAQYIAITSFIFLLHI